MFLLTHQEQRSFYYFIVLVFITALYFSTENFTDVILGFLTTLWGLFGFYRYIYLNSLGNTKLPKILTLPSRILFGLSQQQEQKISLTVDRFLKFDVLLLFLGGFVFVSWGVYCSFYPVDSPLLQSFWKDREDVLQTIDQTYFHYYTILQKLSYYFIIGLIGFIGMSYAKNIFFLKQIKILFLPLIFLLGSYIIFVFPLSSITPYGSFSHIKGIGWEKFYGFGVLAPDQFQNSGSGFLRRYIETGIIGAYGLYVLFLPLFLSFLKRLIKGALRLDYTLSCSLLLTLFFYDFFWVWHPLIGSIQILLWAYLVCFWGNCRFDSMKT